MTVDLRSRRAQTFGTDAGAGLAGPWGWAGLVLLLALLAALLVVDSASRPMQIWDESRNANNALEMVQSGRWLVPTYNGVPDHWNTKPPLMIWMVAGLLRAGVAPLWALRLPSIAAAVATLILVWTTLRYAVRDTTAATVAGALILTSLLYIGPHAARTGDYDALQSFFILAYCLAVWAAFAAGPRPVWLIAAALLVFAAVLTKGVAGGLALPGLALFTLTRPREVLVLVRDPRTWAAVCLAIGLPVGYYLLREVYDPGYLSAVIANEFGGRFNAVNEGHAGGRLFYLQVLQRRFEPGLLLLPLSLLLLLKRDRRRWTLAAATGISGLTLLLVLSMAKTKLWWYATPIVPLLSIPAALGVSETLLWLRSRNLVAERIAIGLLAIGLAFATVRAVRETRMAPARQDGALATRQFWYGRFLTHLAGEGVRRPIVAVDSGLPNSAGFRRYDPMLKFYSAYLSGHGVRVEVQAPGQAIAPDSTVVTCDPASLKWLNAGADFEPVEHDRDCVSGHILRR